MNPNCGCGGQFTAPAPDNRPGLAALSYRAGNHFTFLETMKARLRDQPALLALSKRDGADFSIALLDAWAMVADVLTFYQERIANEGYLRTATERMSILELARLIGYELRPGVASSVYLAYTIDTDRSKPKPAPTFTEIPAGSRAQSIPGPGELPQSFETTELMKASDMWNKLKVRTTRPHTLAATDLFLYFKGITTNLKPGDRLLFDFGDSQTGNPPVRRILTVEPDNDNDRTKVRLDPEKQDFEPFKADKGAPGESLLEKARTLTKTLAKRQPPSQFPGDLTAFTEDSDLIPRLLSAFNPEIAPEQLYSAVENEPEVALHFADVYAFRTRASAFGANAPKKQVFGPNNQIKDSIEWPLTTVDASNGENFKATIIITSRSERRRSNWTFRTSIDLNGTILKGDETGDPGFHDDVRPVDRFEINFAADVIDVTFTQSPFLLEYRFRKRSIAFSITTGTSGVEIRTHGIDPTGTSSINRETGTDVSIEGSVDTAAPWPTEKAQVISLDNSYEKIVPGGWILLEGAMDGKRISMRVLDVKERSRADYGMSGKVTEVTLDKKWLDLNGKTDLSAVRKVAVFAQSEKLELAEFPLDAIKDAITGKCIELDGIYPGLESGRWLIVSGKRNDLKIPAAELVMLSGTEQRSDLNVPGDKRHTFLKLAGGLANTYDPNSVTIYGNVVQATHGETRTEVLGNGDARRHLQEFALKQFPLTYVSAATPTGVKNSLSVRVNDIRWDEAPGLASLGPNDRSFITRTGEDAKTSVIFGNGVRGARVPTGVENVKAVYRTGIGKAGNVKAEQISILSTKPLGVKEVINPIRASGGADRETRDQARRNAPLAVMSLDRLVSIQDFADFARTFAGVSKAIATQSHGRVQVTIAGADGIPINETSSLFRNLEAAFGKFGDPQQPMQLAVYQPLLLVIQAKVAILPAYQFETVAPKIRAALLAAFAFDNRDLGQDVLRSEILATMQNVEGAEYIDLDTLATISSQLNDLPSEQSKPRKRIPVSPGQLAYLTPDISETLILTELVNAR